MSIIVKNEAFLEIKGDMYIIPVFEGTNDQFFKEYLGDLAPKIKMLFDKKEIQGKYKKKTIHTFSKKGSDGKLVEKTILFIGVGKIKELSDEKIRDLSGYTIKEASAFEMDIVVMPQWCPKEDGVRAQLQGATLAMYVYDKFHTEKKHRVKKVILASRDKAAPKIAKEVNIVCENVSLARDLQNYPANVATPSFLEKTAKAFAKDNNNVKIKVIEKEEIKKLGMGAFYAVAQGAQEPAKLVIIEYNGGKKGVKPLAFIGKGITFDTGGISLKSQSSAIGGIEDMKYDMSGSAVILAFMKTLAELKMPVNAVGLLALTENVPDSVAYKPGDILKSLSGKTIEVISTDAEGRLVLCDTITYSKKYNPKFIVDIATLTGAAVITFGNFATGLMGNDDKLIGMMSIAGENTGERVWQLPQWDEYKELIKTKFADIKNVGGIKGGTITAGMFLKEFAGDTPWLHLDIAGSAYGVTGKSYIPDTGSGVGLRLLLEFTKNYIDKK